MFKIWLFASGYGVGYHYKRAGAYREAPARFSSMIRNKSFLPNVGLFEIPLISPIRIGAIVFKGVDLKLRHVAQVS